MCAGQPSILDRTAWKLILGSIGIVRAVVLVQFRTKRGPVSRLYVVRRARADPVVRRSNDTRIGSVLEFGDSGRDRHDLGDELARGLSALDLKEGQGTERILFPARDVVLRIKVLA